MPEFLLRYRIPNDLELDHEIRLTRKRVVDMAKAIQAKVEEIFEQNVVWEAAEFDISAGMPNFYVTGWVTDNENNKTDLVNRAQEEIIEIMKSLAYDDETVDCWFQKVTGKWSGGVGKLKKPKKNP